MLLVPLIIEDNTGSVKTKLEAMQLKHVQSIGRRYYLAAGAADY